MRKRTRGRLVTAIIAAGLAGGLVLGNPSALADPAVPPPAPIDPAAAPAPPPDPPAAPPRVDPLAAQPAVIPPGTPAGQNPTPYTGQPVFAPPTFNPVNGSMVGVAKPIYITFARPIPDRAMGQPATHISS